MQQAVLQADHRRPLAIASQRAWISAAIVVAIAALAAAIRFHHLGKQPFWNDEGFTWWAVQHSWRELWTVVPQDDPHPQLYHSLLKLWSDLFGRTEVGLRSLAALIGTVTVLPVFLLGRMLGGRRDGLWTGTAAALLFALSALHLHYAHEARPYAALTFAATVAFAGALWLMLHPDAAQEPLLGWRSRTMPDGGAPSARPAWLALIVGTALALWLHNLGIFLAATLGLAFLVWLGRDLRWSGRAFANMVLAAGIVLLLWLPQLPWLVAQTMAVGESWYLSFPTPATVLKVLSALFGLGFRIDPPLFVAGVVLAAVGLVIIGRRVGFAVACLLLLGMVLPIVLSLLLSWLFKPIFLERTLVWASIPFYLALAGLLLPLPAFWLRLPVLLLAALVSWQGAVKYDKKYKKEPWDRIVRTVAHGLQPGGVVLVMPPYTLPMMQYYDQQTGAHLPLVTVPIAREAEPGRPAPDEIMGPTVVTPQRMDQLEQRIAGVPDVWLVYRRTGDLGRTNDQVLDYLRATRPELQGDLLYGSILWLYHFGPPKGATPP